MHGVVVGVDNSICRLLHGEYVLDLECWILQQILLEPFHAFGGGDSDYGEVFPNEVE
jgi:hypothetical protein